MKELKTKERKNSLVNKYSDEKSSILDSLVKNSAYLNMWEEILHPPLGEIHILLKFSSRLEPTDQIYSNIANEIYI